MTTPPPVLALIGCGKMGGAMLRGWLDLQQLDKIIVVDPEALPEEFQNNAAIHHVKIIDDLPRADIIVLAVKPQIMQPVLSDLKPKISANSLILSIAAGIKITRMEQAFGSEQPIIRAMPNTPAAIGKGITVAIANENVALQQKQAAQALLSAIGTVHWLEDESLMDAVTALSGSGPAYVFLLIECLANAGTACGLDPNMAMTLARQTVIGSAALAEKDDMPAAALRKNVTSPGGTTEAALTVLMDGQLEDVFVRALKAATKRSQELSK